MSTAVHRIEGPGGEELIIDQPMIEVSCSQATADPNWEATCANGDRVTLQTARWVVDRKVWCEMCEDEHEEGHYECPDCEDRVTPGTLPAGSVQYVPGVRSITLNGEPISEERATQLVEEWGARVVDAASRGLSAPDGDLREASLIDAIRKVVAAFKVETGESLPTILGGEETYLIKDIAAAMRRVSDRAYRDGYQRGALFGNQEHKAELDRERRAADRLVGEKATAIHERDLAREAYEALVTDLRKIVGLRTDLDDVEYVALERTLLKPEEIPAVVAKLREEKKSR